MGYFQPWRQTEIAGETRKKVGEAMSQRQCDAGNIAFCDFCCFRCVGP